MRGPPSSGQMSQGVQGVTTASVAGRGGGWSGIRRQLPAGTCIACHGTTVSVTGPASWAFHWRVSCTALALGGWLPAA